jgi:SAM-dependent methyltransferase
MSEPLDRLLGLDRIPPAPPRPARPAEPVAGNVRDLKRLLRLLPILRCPETGQALELAADGSLRTADGGRSWPTIAGRANLFPGMAEPAVHAVSHVSNALDQTALALIRQTQGWVLNLSAGGSAQEFEHVVEAEAAIFRHTDVLADAHRLPFADGCFEAVVAYNAFEHYRDPRAAAAQILRVLRPGGQVLVRTAFLQPLHEAPWHFYNCTKYGLMQWFEGFETAAVRVSDNFHPGHALAWLASECEAALRRDVSGVAAELFSHATVGEFVAMWRGQAPRSSRLWRNFARLSPGSQEALAAGFEYVGRKPLK